MQPLSPDYLPTPDRDRDRALLALRQRAEQRRHLVTQPGAQQSAEALQHLVHELQVHQIELEMQNEELLLAQTEVQRARGQYVDLYDFAPVGYVTVDATGTIEQLNLRASQLLGTSRLQLEGRRFALFVVPADRAAFQQFVSQALTAEHSLSCELRLLRDDGTPFFAQLEALRADEPVYAGSARPAARCRLALLDSSARRAATDALAANEARFRSVFEHNPDGMVLIEDGYIVDGNAAVLRLFGLPDKSRLVGKLVGFLSPGRQPGGVLSAERMRENLATARREGWCRFEWYRLDEAGQEQWLEVTAAPVIVGRLPLMQCAVRDITAQREAQQRLRASEERRQLALEAAGLGVWTLDSNPDLLTADARAWAILGRPDQQEPLPFEEILSQVCPADQPTLVAARQQALKSDHPVELEVRLLVPGQELRHLLVRGRLSVNAPGGPPARLTGVVSDITARREAEEELGYKNRLLDHILENLPIMLGQLSPEGRYLEMLGQGLRRMGLRDNELRGQSVFDAFPTLAEPTRRLLAGEQVNFMGAAEVNGKPVYMQSYGFFDQQRQRAVVFAIDVTEMMLAREEAAELRLRQQQQVLAATLESQETERRRIAESLHNGLGQLLYAAKLALSGAATAASNARVLHLLDEAVRTTRTISFELTPSVLNDFGLVDALQEMLKRLPPRPLAVSLLVPSSGAQRLPPAVEIAAYRIAQELLNNVIKHAHATKATLRLALDSDRLRLVLEDNGRGFDPAAVGTNGLGLRSIRNRVEVLAGQLTIDAQVGRGTAISVELPVE